LFPSVIIFSCSRDQACKFPHEFARCVHPGKPSESESRTCEGSVDTQPNEWEEEEKRGACLLCPDVKQGQHPHRKDKKHEDVATASELESPVYPLHGPLQVTPRLVHGVLQAVQNLRVQPGLVLNIQRQLRKFAEQAPNARERVSLVSATRSFKILLTDTESVRVILPLSFFLSSP